MEKPAENQYPIHELIQERWSPRSFRSDKKVEKSKLLSLLEAARWAPSCFNEQPWRFLVFSEETPQDLENARSCLTEGNRWAKSAPVLLLSVAKNDFTKNGKPNRHSHHDVGLAVENLVLQATSLGLAVHQMAGFDSERSKKEFKIPSGYTPLAMIAIGYQGSVDELEEDFREKETSARSRKSLNEFVFLGKWSEAFSDKP